MKYAFLISTIFLLLSCSGTNSAPDHVEETTFLKQIEDTGNSRGVTVEQTADGGYILTGFTTAGDYGGDDLLLIKTNANGETSWRKTFGGEGDENGWAVRQIEDGGYIILGFTNSFGNGEMDIYLIRTDSEGEMIWTKTYGGEGEEYGWDVRITNDNGFIIAAQTNSLGAGELDAYLIKVDKDGNEIWSKTYGGDKVDRVFSVQQTPDGGYAAAGITYSFDSIDENDRDGYLLKTNASGEQEWYKTFGGDHYDVAHAIGTTNDGGLIITGYGESYSASESRDVYLIKTNQLGEEQWIKVYGDAGEERGIKGIQTKDGGYIAIGFIDTNKDVYLIKINSKGDPSWKRTYGTPEHYDFGYTVNETNDGGYILTGHSVHMENGKSSILMVKTNGEGLVE